MWSFLGGLVGGIFKAAVDLFMRRQQRADQIELGQQRRAVAQHQAAEAATKRMQEAAAEPHDADTTQGRLDRGQF